MRWFLTAVSLILLLWGLYFFTDGSGLDSVGRAQVEAIAHGATLPHEDSGVINVRDYGAVGDGVADDTAAIQAALGALDNGDVLYLPSTDFYNGKCYKITSALKLPTKSGIVICGAGKRASVIQQVTADANGFDPPANHVSGVVIRDLWIASNGLGKYGLTWGTKTVSCSRGQLLNVRFSGWTAGAGVWVEAAIITDMRGCDFDGNKDGIYSQGGGIGNLNGWSVSGCSFENQTQYAINTYSMFGSSITGCCFEANLQGGIRFTMVGGGVSLSGNYFEENRDFHTGHSKDAFDIYIGTNSYWRGMVIEGNYFNGSDTEPNYYPIKIKYADGCRIAHNFLTQGSRFISFTAGGSVTNSTFGEIAFHSGTPDHTLGSGATYGRIPVTFVNSGNILCDPGTFGVSHKQNLLRGDLPYGGWAASLGGDSTWTRAPNSGATPDAFHGRPVGLLTRSGGIAILTQSFMVSGTQNSFVRDSWVTFAIDYYVNSDSTRYLELAVDDAVSQGRSCTFSGNTLAGWQTAYISGYFNVTTTTLRALIIANSEVEYRFANPRLYIGLEPRGGSEGPIEFRSRGVPTAGTWEMGDVVHNTAVGATGLYGWTCITAGTPGTWMPMMLPSMAIDDHGAGGPLGP